MWLELNKIRYLAPEDRQPLKDTAAKQWPQALTHYLAQLFSSAPQSTLSTANPPPTNVVDALLRYAVAVEYTDGAAEYNKRAKTVRPAVNPALQSTAQQLPTYSEADIRTGLVALTNQMRLPNPDTFQPPLSTLQLLTSLTALLTLHTSLPAPPATTQPGQPSPPPDTAALLTFVAQLPLPPEDRQHITTANPTPVQRRRRRPSGGGGTGGRTAAGQRVAAAGGAGEGDGVLAWRAAAGEGGQAGGEGGYEEGGGGAVGVVRITADTQTQNRLPPSLRCEVCQLDVDCCCRLSQSESQRDQANIYGIGKKAKSKPNMGGSYERTARSSTQPQRPLMPSHALLNSEMRRTACTTTCT